MLTRTDMITGLAGSTAIISDRPVNVENNAPSLSVQAVIVTITMAAVDDRTGKQRQLWIRVRLEGAKQRLAICVTAENQLLLAILPLMAKDDDGSRAGSQDGSDSGSDTHNAFRTMTDIVA